ncbi:hypothetical protein OBBRIDRAFT_733279 [Obba rivulosa]|uniref:USE1-like protein n=1 Tax=Obba rivulosa TaxID=1052685 RepID=A0A8E2AVZ2_9APHY|nr:hypothetical protein OBBRIDRAFT_733279 [Obba rivulosa]
MSLANADQRQHDKINLHQLVRRLEKTVATDDWAADDVARPAWVKTRGTLQKLKYARRLLRNVELYEDDAYVCAMSRYEMLRETLDRLEKVVLEVDQRVAPKAVPLEPILPTLPIPVSRPVEPAAASPAPQSPGDSAPITSDESLASVSAQDLLLSSSDTEPIRPAPVPSSSSTLLPPTLPKFADQSAAPALQNSAALHEELSAQLAHMAAQLKRNTLHFSAALEDDKSVLGGTQEKLERNYEVMSKERVRLRDHRAKSWGTTWIVMLSLIVAAVGFLLTFFVIRLT